MALGRQARLELYEQEKEALLSRVPGASSALLAVRTTPGGWSVSETLEHLVLSERVLLGNLRPVGELRARAVGIRHHLGYAAVMAILRLRIPVPVPDPAMEPSGGWTLDDVRRRWEENGRWFEGYLSSLADGPAPAAFRHPVAGPLTADRLLRMARWHLAYHAPAILRVVAQGAR